MVETAGDAERRPAGPPSWAVLLLLLAAVGVVYGPFLRSPFVFDDYHSVVENPSIRRLENIPEFFSTGRGFSVHSKWHSYRPLLLSSYSLSYALTGPEAWSFRIVNFVLHACNAWIVFLLLRGLLGAATGSAAALAGSLVFTLHPGQTQAVMYVSSRSELLAATFVLLALLFFLRGLQEGSGPRGWRGGWLPAAVSFALALCAKESAVLFLPAAALLCLVVMPELSWRQLGRAAARLAPFALLYLAATRAMRALISTAVQAGGALPAVSSTHGSPSPVAATGADGAVSDFVLRLVAFGEYPRLALFPHPLSIFHQLPEQGPALIGAVVVSVASLLLLVGGAWVAFARGQRLFALGLAWLPAVLAPYFFATLTMKVNEHRLHLALFGVAVLVAEAVRRSAGRTATRALLAAVLLACLVGTVARNRQWSDPERFLLNEISAAPDLAWPHQSLAGYYADQGRTDEARQAYERARVRRDPNLGLIHNFYGRQAAMAGRLGEAAEEFLRAVAWDPWIPDYLVNLGSVLDDLGRRDEAEQYLRRAVSVAKCSTSAEFNLGVLYARSGRMAEAERAFVEAIGCDEGSWRAHASLGIVMLESGRGEPALRHLERAASLPGADGQTQYQLARARARAGQLDAAVDALERASALGYPSGREAPAEPDFVPLRSMPRWRTLTAQGSPR